jgi:hypothetical protein
MQVGNYKYQYIMVEKRTSGLKFCIKLLEMPACNLAKLVGHVLKMPQNNFSSVQMITDILLNTNAYNYT